MPPRVLLAAAAILVGLGVAAFFLWPDDNGGPDGPGRGGAALAPEERLQLAGRGRQALAFLENEELEEAVGRFEELAEALPESVFARRNLAIGLLMQLDAVDRLRDAARFEELSTRTAEAVKALDRISDAAADAVLAGRLQRILDNEAEAIQQFEIAAERNPDDAALAYESWVTGRESEDEGVRVRALAGLVAAHRLAPENVFVLLDLLLVRAEDEEPLIADDIDALSAVLAPFAAGILARTRADVREFLAAAQEAVTRDDWATVKRNVRIVANVTRPDALAQSDRLRVDRNPLHYVVTNLDAELVADLKPAPAPAIPVSFVTDDDLPRLARARAVLLRDVDGDGRADIVTLYGARLQVDRRTDGGFEPMAVAELGGEFTGLAAADFDADYDPGEEAANEVEQGDAADADTDGDATRCGAADLDFVVWGPGGIRVVENRFDPETGTRSLLPVDAEPLSSLSAVTAVAVVDVDHDGDLDLVAASASGVHVLSHASGFEFDDVSGRSSLPEGALSSLVAADLDGDGDTDLVAGRAADSTEPSGWFENLRHGRLRWRDVVGFPPATVFEVLDVDGDGAWEVLAATDESTLLVPTRLVPDGVLWESTRTLDVEPLSAVTVWDFDNDGTLDLLGHGPSGTTLLRGTNEDFEPVTERAGLPADATLFDVEDLDADGDLDVLAVGGGQATTYRNEGGNANGWIRIGLQAQQIRGSEASASGRVNQHGIGSRLQLRVGLDDRLRIVRRPTTHFGLGDESAADAIRVLWTNGIPLNVIAPEANQVICERQTLKGSCPYLYTWDGERFVFVTDLLWAAPIGLQFAENVLAPARSWEHLRVPGAQLKPRDGFYELRITEELWEVGYFDHVALTAVDHPADVEVFTNEKVGPPSIAEPRLHTVRNPRSPRTIRDGRGNDLRTALGKRDEIYAKTFHRKLRQGLAEEHALEIDFGDVTEAKTVTLFLAGWVYPTDTSLNVALSQDDRLPSPRPPSLQVPDGDGGWRTAMPYTGFPGGKTKTIAIDVSAVLVRDDPRVRLVTNMEFYWDHVFFTVDEEPVEFRERPLEIVSAELRYRGFSRESFPEGLGPHRYDYDDVSTEPKWLPIRGGFTRFGDVRELIAETDDRLVMMGPGDEMMIRFRVPEDPPPPGWVRDFVIHNVGWDKDADLNTVYGETVEPLPFGKMSRYPYAPEETYPQRPDLQRDRELLHTRRQ